MIADKDQIRERSDIVEVIGQFVPLKKRGRTYVGLCPFHQEKTPSFHVDPNVQMFKCFGCSAGGDVFRFIEQYQNMSFVEAAEFLAKRVGLTFARRGGEASPERLSEREKLLALNSLAARYYQSVLERAPAAKTYLQGRGLAHQTIHQFQLGFAPEDWDNLTRHLRSQQQDLEAAEAAGLVKLGARGDYFDMFRNRIIFPIQDEQERVVGFGGRAMGDEQPKYLNTGETPVFAKSRLLYGLSFARRKIADQGKTLLMEGYMDVIAAHQAGFQNAVATLGTSLTEEHAKKLGRLAPAVVLVYDADNAGIKATLRASELLEQEGVQVFVARLPQGDDPDSILKRGDTVTFQKCIDQAIGRVEYQLERIVAMGDLSSDAGRAKVLQQVVYILGSVASYAERDAYIEKIWQLAPSLASNPGFAKQQLHTDARASALRQLGRDPAEANAALPRMQDRRNGSQFGQGGRSPRDGNRRNDSYKGADRSADYRRSDAASPRPTPGPPPPSPGATAEQRAEREMIRALGDPEWYSLALRAAGEEDMLTELGRRFYRFAAAHAAELAEPGALVDVLNRDEEEDFSLAIRQYLQESNTTSEKVPLSEPTIRGCAQTLKKHHLEERKRHLAQEMAILMQASQDRGVLSALDRERLQELNRLLRELKGSDRPASVQGER